MRQTSQLSLSAQVTQALLLLLLQVLVLMLFLQRLDSLLVNLLQHGTKRRRKVDKATANGKQDAEIRR